ncbi:MAG: type III pantothenate kinase [Desulfobacterales bacterium]|nr:type III pantothenate kinase [Desulfobacterales bacterium]
MIFVIDVGNTNTVMGVYEGAKLIQSWRVRTERNATEDEFHVLASNLFAMHAIDTGTFSKTVISCVVPPMMTILDAFCRKYLGQAPIWVDPRNCAAMPILYDNPAEVGADRIVNAVGAYERYRTSMIIIDFGTATTFDAISARGEYMGGAISPGIQIASEALFQKASKLPRVDILKPPDEVIGKDTTSSIKAGIIYGYAGLVDGMVRRMAREIGGTPKVIATGGLAPLMKDVSETIQHVELDLTLEGLRIISEAADAAAL